MTFIFCLAAVLLLTLYADGWIKKHAGLLYGISALLAAGIAAGTAFSPALPEFISRFLWNPLARGSLAAAFFVPVMYAGAVETKSPLRKKWMPIRGELSIIASILTLGHNLAAGQKYFVPLFTRPAELSLSHLLASICSLVMIAVMLPLFVTSFRSVRRKMDPAKWKKLQRWAYLFYTLTYVHVLLLYVPQAREGDFSALLSILIFSAVFLPYAAMRIARELERRNAGNRRLPAAAAAVTAAVLAAVSIPWSGFSSLSETGPAPESSESAPSESASSGETAPQSKYRDGTYTGKGKGYAGPVEVSVVIKNDRILSISILAQEEDEPYWTKSLVTVDRILESQSVKVHGVTSATKSCNGIKKAVKDALKSAENK